MAEKHALFYNSENGDRVYDVSDFEDWIKKFFTSGTFIGEMQVTAAGGMKVHVAMGYINIEGKIRNFDEEIELDVTTAHATYNRIDNIVVERRDADRDFFVKVVTGSATDTPTPPARVYANGVYQMVLAQVQVTAGATEINQADITDTRADSELCGFVAATVDQIDFSQIQAQYDAFMANYRVAVQEDFEDYEDSIAQYEADEKALFEAWFEEIKGQLSDDAAGRLQNEVNELADGQKFITQTKTTTFPNANTIRETWADGRYKDTVMNGNTITETLYINGAAVSTKTTTINSNSITEEVQ